MTTAPTRPVTPDRPGAISLGQLGLGFLQIGLMGFGGVAPSARRVIVEERQWLSDEEYAAVLGVGQILPGANIVNASVIIGDRFRGPLGSLVAVSALMAAPLAILILVATLYDHFNTLIVIKGAMSGVAAAAAGLVVGTGVKMARRLPRDPLTIGLGAAGLIGVAVFKAPLALVVLIVAPLGVIASILSARR